MPPQKMPMALKTFIRSLRHRFQISPKQGDEYFSHGQITSNPWGRERESNVAWPVVTYLDH